MQKKKVGKERLDKYYHLAKEQGFRARSAFKLIQLNKKYNFLESARVLVDLCAAPGGWLQVASKYMPVSHVIIGIDLVAIKPIPNVITFTGDILTEKCRTDLKKELKTWKVDVFLHDGAPNVGSAWNKDAYSQSELVLMALKLAAEFLVPNGWFITKVFRSKDYNALMWVFNQLFEKVEATKPPSSRNASAEIFVVCQGFKAPKKIDPRFFDPKAVFEELETKVKPANIFHPEKRIRQREGYEDGNLTLYKTISAAEFASTPDPTSALGLYSKIDFEDEESKKLMKLPCTNDDILSSCEDLKVLGRKEFRNLLKWRLKLVDHLTPKPAEVDLSEDENLAGESESEEDVGTILENLSKEEARKVRKDKKKRLERKAKQRMRFQLGMDVDEPAPFEHNEEPLFTLPKDKVSSFVNEEMKDLSDHSASESEKSDSDDEDEMSDEEDKLNLLDAQLESDYQRYKEKLIDRDPKLKIKAQRSSYASFDGFDKGSDEEESNEEVDLGSDYIENEEEIDDEDPTNDIWYSNPLFKKFEENDEEALDKGQKRQQDFGSVTKASKKQKKASSEETESCEIEFVKSNGQSKEFTEEEKMKFLTVDGIAMGRKMMNEKTKKDLIDDSFNRYAFNDQHDLPPWFKEDESRHNRPQIPPTKETMKILKDKLKAIDARPIKKVLEAKGRQKMKALKKIESIKKKAEIIADSEDISESQKAKQIQKMIKNGSKSKKKEIKVVVARGSNRGNKGRPKGTKGRYKMVDSRLRKDDRAQKRTEKSRGGRKGRK